LRSEITITTCPATTAIATTATTAATASSYNKTINSRYTNRTFPFSCGVKNFNDGVITAGCFG
jgi:hypothetical protein